MSALHIDIDWVALGRVVAISTAAGIAIVAAFAIGIVGLSRAEGADSATGQARRHSGYLLAATAHGLCIAAVIYGLYWLIPQFHH